MSEDEHLEYLHTELLHVDSDWNLRSNFGDFPLTVNRRQLQLSIEYIQKREAMLDDW